MSERLITDVERVFHRREIMEETPGFRAFGAKLLAVVRLKTRRQEEEDGTLAHQDAPAQRKGRHSAAAA